MLLIHFLQRRAKVVPVATLFLLERTQRESVSGRRFERLINSVPLWMQLLAVLLLTWLLVEPRYRKARTVQRVAVVLDASASMEVFREPLAKRLADELPRLVGPAASAEFTLFESVPGGPRLYAGGSADDLLAAVRGWRPRAGVTDPTHALRLARSLVSRDGIVVFATDTPRDTLPFDALLLAVGEPVANVGFTGVSFERREGALIWQALVRNYSDQPAARTWSVESPDGSRSPPTAIDLAPGALVHVQAAFPPAAERIRVALDPDRFTLDDSLPLVAPQPKPLTLHRAAEAPGFADLTERIVRSLDAVAATADGVLADLTLVRYDPLSPVLPAGNAIVFLGDDTQGGDYLKGGLLAEADPLMDGLNWQPLLVRETIPLTPRPADKVLLWQGSRRLVIVRETAGADNRRSSRQLCFNFDIRLSNALRLPAFAVLVHRFCEELRAAKIAPERAVLETAEPITLAADPGGPPVASLVVALNGSPAGSTTVPATARLHTEAPRDPGFLQIRQGDLALLDAAVHFGDTREADFSDCAAADTLDSATAGAIQRHTREDHWWRAWFLALVLVLLVAWQYTKTSKS